MIADDTLQAADKIRDQLNVQVTSLRSNANLSPDARTARLARAYLEAKAAMDALQVTGADNTQSRVRALTARVWGLDDVAGQNGTDRASASVSYRDAQDRAAAVEDLQEALALLARAEATGDELLARALAARAASEPFGSWDDVLDGYFDVRPAKVNAFVELRDLSRSQLSTTTLFGFILPVPSELENMPEYRVQALASDPRFAGV